MKNFAYTHHIERVKALFTSIHNNLPRQRQSAAVTTCKVPRNSPAQLSMTQADADQDIESDVVGGNVVTVISAEPRPTGSICHVWTRGRGRCV